MDGSLSMHYLCLLMLNILYFYIDLITHFFKYFIVNKPLSRAATYYLFTRNKGKREDLKLNEHNNLCYTEC